MKTIINILFKYKQYFLLKVLSTGNILVNICKNGGNYMLRSADFAARSNTFAPYFQDKEKLITLLEGMDKPSQELLQKTLHKIRHVMCNNYMNRKIVNTKEDLEKINQYYTFISKGNTDSYFDKYEHLNEYYIPHDCKRYDIQLDGGDILDCGAYIGDSAVTFSKLYENSHVYSFEPDPDTYKKLQATIDYFHLTDKISAVPLGVGDREEEVKLSQSGPGSKITEDGDIAIKVTTIDSYVSEHNLQPKLIKWDIEGLEYNSILGAEKTIKDNKPYLFISIYHSGRDFFEIKPLLESWNLGYTFSITRRNYIAPFADTLLVAIPPK